MTPKNISKTHNQNALRTPLKQAEPASGGRFEYPPTNEEVAKRAYLNYLNGGSIPGHDLQHWLEAQTQLRAEQKLTRDHGFRNGA